MAHFDGPLENSKGNIINIRVPSLQGGTDRNIYKNGDSTGYRLGDGDNEIYTESGRHVSELPLKEFVKEFLWNRAWFIQGSFLLLKIKN